MTSRGCISVVLLAAMASACGGPLKTGTVSHPGDASPPEPACPNDYVLCGTGPSAVCADFQTDPEHCGSCAKACSPDVACVAGVCQRVVCQGQPMFSGTPLASTPLLDSTFGGAILADVNGDGYLDFIYWQHIERKEPQPGRLFVALGQGEGRFGTPQSYTIAGGVRRVQVADINHDGAEDLFVLELGSVCMELWLGHTDGLLTLGPGIPMTHCGWLRTVADLSGDGHFAVVTTSDSAAGIDVYLPASTGEPQYAGTYATEAFPLDLVVNDWNGDGFSDLIVMGHSLLLLYNRGDGTFDDAVDCGLAVGTCVVSDFNHDGHMDLAAERFGMETSNGVDVLFGLGGCRFAAAAGYDVKGGCNLLKLVDMDGDGQLDLVCVSNDAVTTLLGNPDGTFQATAPSRLVGAAGFDSILLGDVTGDGRPDVIVADRHGPVSVWENTCR